jgi:hypothetical protein
MVLLLRACNPVDYARVLTGKRYLDRVFAAVLLERGEAVCRHSDLGDVYRQLAASAALPPQSITELTRSIPNKGIPQLSLDMPGRAQLRARQLLEPPLAGTREPSYDLPDSLAHFSVLSASLIERIWESTSRIADESIVELTTRQRARDTMYNVLHQAVNPDLVDDDEEIRAQNEATSAETQFGGGHAAQESRLEALLVETQRLVAVQQQRQDATEELLRQLLSGQAAKRADDRQPEISLGQWEPEPASTSRTSTDMQSATPDVHSGRGRVAPGGAQRDPRKWSEGSSVSSHLQIPSKETVQSAANAALKVKRFRSSASSPSLVSAGSAAVTPAAGRRY